MQQGMNVTREAILFKSYLTLTDVRNFMRCSWKKAHELFDKCNELAKTEKKINPVGKVYYKYLLQATGIDEKDVHRLANIERTIQKKMLPSPARQSI